MLPPARSPPRPQVYVNAKVQLTWLNGTAVTTQPKVTGTWSATVKGVAIAPYTVNQLAGSCPSTTCGVAWFISNAISTAGVPKNASSATFTITGVTGFTLAAGSMLSNSITW